MDRKWWCKMYTNNRKKYRREFRVLEKFKVSVLKEYTWAYYTRVQSEEICEVFGENGVDIRWLRQ